MNMVSEKMMSREFVIVEIVSEKMWSNKIVSDKMMFGVFLIADSVS